MLTPTEVLYPNQSWAVGLGEESDDPSLIADVDWATGIIRMHISYDLFRSLIAGGEIEPGSDRAVLLESLTHECMHVLQMLNTGFAYNLSLECLKTVVRALHDNPELDDLYRAREAYTRQLQPVQESLLVPSEDGIRPIDLLEGPAFLVQKRTHWKDLGPQRFERMLQDEVTEDAAYRRAYDLATDVLGEDAFDHLPHIATLALQTREPQNAYRPLLEAIHSRGSRLDRRRNHQVGLELLNSQFRESLLGHPLELCEQGRVHPVLMGSLRLLNDEEGRNEGTALNLTAAPHALSQLIANVLVGPTLFPPTTPGGSATMYVPTVWADRARDGVDRAINDPGLLARLVAASALILMDIEPVPVVPPGFHQLRASYDLPIISRQWSFEPENRTPETINHFAELLAEIENDPAKARMLRGTISITFPDFDNRGSPLLDPDVRSFIRAFYHRIPHLLYYLSDTPLAGSLLACAVAHANDADVVEGPGGEPGVRLTDPDLIMTLMHYIKMAAICARRMGMDPAVMQGLVQGIGSTTIQALLTNTLLDTD